MRILHIEDEPWDSGIAHYALTLAAELRRRGHEAHFWGRAGSPLLDLAARAGLRTRALRRPWTGLHGLRGRVRELGIELIDAHTGNSHALAAALAAFTGIAVVRTRGDARRAAKHPLARLLAKRTQAFIAANSCIHRELSEAFPGARIVTVFQGIAAGPALPLTEAPVFGILGRLDPVKGHETFLDAAARVLAEHPAARFEVIGGGPAERCAFLEHRAGKLGLGEVCVFRGHVADVPAAQARCRVGVVASLGSEAVSRAALEWMAAGRPVVASSVGCLPDLVADGETGFLVPPGDAEALSEALCRFLRAPDLAARLGAQGRKRFEDLFSLRRFGDETERVYKEALDHHAG